MMTPKATSDNKGVDQLTRFLKVHNQSALDLAEETFQELRPRNLDEFRRSPRVRSYPADYPGGQLPFDTLKQQRWYWANIGKPYTRTGRMTKSLEQTIDRSGKAVTITASYPTASTKYVLGNILGETVQPYQQRFHAATGWELAAPKLERHAEHYYETYVRRYAAFVAFSFG
jgi:aldehyde:ferredoxin oxidoreductase